MSYRRSAGFGLLAGIIGLCAVLANGDEGSPVWGLHGAKATADVGPSSVGSLVAAGKPAVLAQPTAALPPAPPDAAARAGLVSTDSSAPAIDPSLELSALTNVELSELRRQIREAAKDIYSDRWPASTARRDTVVLP